MHNKTLNRFFSSNKALLSRTKVASLERSNFLLLFEYGFMRSNLDHLGGYATLTEMLLICQISSIFILSLYDQGG